MENLERTAESVRDNENWVVFASPRRRASVLFVDRCVCYSEGDDLVSHPSDRRLVDANAVDGSEPRASLAQFRQMPPRNHRKTPLVRGVPLLEMGLKPRVLVQRPVRAEPQELLRVLLVHAFEVRVIKGEPRFGPRLSSGMPNSAFPSRRANGHPPDPGPRAPPRDTHPCIWSLSSRRIRA